jgi:hypothetical protein
VPRLQGFIHFHPEARHLNSIFLLLWFENYFGRKIILWISFFIVILEPKMASGVAY